MRAAERSRCGGSLQEPPRKIRGVSDAQAERGAVSGLDRCARLVDWQSATHSQTLPCMS